MSDLRASGCGRSTLICTQVCATTRTSVDATLLYLSWWYRAHVSLTAGDTLAVSLQITDGTNTVGPSTRLFPETFQGVTTRSRFGTRSVLAVVVTVRRQSAL